MCAPADVPTLPTSNELSLSCPGCDAMFFGELMEELEKVVGCFNTRAQELLQLHLASGFRKFLLYLTSSNLDRAAMLQQGQSLVSYAFINATAVRKILKKYDKVHQSNNGGVLKRRLLALRGELLQSPWILELTALHLNLADTPAMSSPVIEGLGEFSCDFESDSPTLYCTILESARLEFGLNCSICLDTVFDPVALGCGHVFCNSCVCAAASVPAYEGPRAADSSAKCPLCRKVGVYLNAVRLKELATLVHSRCKTYWTERLHKERKEQLREAKMASERILHEVMRA